jgi:molybdopterin/thiamine biosynthesis adenylyltransferase
VRLVFCGVGALGSHAAVLCRNLGVGLALVDFDRVESKNLLAQAFTKQSLGRNKAEALRLQLLNFHGVRAEAFPVRLEQTNVGALAAGAGLLVDCLDNVAGRTVLSSHARATGIPLVARSAQRRRNLRAGQVGRAVRCRCRGHGRPGDV